VLEDLVDAIARGEKIIIQDESGQTRAYNHGATQPNFSPLTRCCLSRHWAGAAGK
jgi:hypothetical protein